MNVVYSSSDSYTMVAGISMYSLLCNNKDAKELNIFMIDNQIKEEGIKTFSDNNPPTDDLGDNGDLFILTN